MSDESPNSDEMKEALQQAEQQALKYGHDVAAIYKAERQRRAELESALSFVRSLLEHMSDGLLAVDGRLRIVDSNARARKMIGLTEDPKDRKLSDVLGLVDLSRAFEEIQARALAGVLKPWRGQSVPPTAKSSTLEIVAMPPGKQGNVWTILLRDITRDERVKQVRQDMMGLLGEGLKNPVNQLLSVVELISNCTAETDPSAIADARKMLKENTDQLRRSLQSLLEFAEIGPTESGRDFQTFSISTIVNIVAEKIQGEMAGKGVALDIRCDVALPAIQGDVRLLQRGIEEILRRSLALSLPGTGVTVACALNTEARSVSIVVDDDVPVSANSRQEASSETQGNKGLFEQDMGLALARHVARMHGGEIEVAPSTIRKGTRTALVLPIATTQERNEVAKLREEVETLRRQNMVYAVDMARTYSQGRFAQKTLAQSREQASRSAKLAELGRMAAAIAHDMGNILSPISGYSGLLLMQKDLNEKARSHATRIQQATDRAIDMLRRIKEFGTPSRGTRTLVRVGDVMNAAVGLLEYTLKKSGIQLQLQVAQELPCLLGDAGQLEQVLVNLMVNASDAMIPQGGTLILSARKQDDEICIDVVDTGAGIPPEIQAQIFESFFTTKESGKGTGLGLFICKEIIEQHSGRILFESKVGVGTTFKVILPVANMGRA